MIFFGQREERFGQKLYSERVHGNFPRARFEHLARNAYDVADVVFLERGVFFAEVVDRKIDLYLPLAVEHVGESRLAHEPFAHQSAGDGDRGSFEIIVLRFDVFAEMRSRIFYFFIGIFPRRLQSGELFPADFHDLVEIGLRLYVCVYAVVVLHLLTPRQNQNTFLISSTAVPSGTATSTTSPAFLPRSALPMGDSLLILPASRSASVVPTIS